MKFGYAWLFILSTICPNLTAADLGNTADYVIVGVGTSGAAVARILSDDKSNSVIALHNGNNLSQSSKIKFSKNALFTSAQASTGGPYYITSHTVPQPFADDRSIPWSLATLLGGSSAVNAGVYSRGTEQGYAGWEALAGPQWSVDNIFKLYKDLEKFHGDTSDWNTRGYKGFLPVYQVRNVTEISKTFTIALQKATGLPYILDYSNTHTPIGTSFRLQYAQRGRGGELRVSSVNAFLRHTIDGAGNGKKGRKLKILYNSYGLKTIWEGNKAIGVEYLQNGVVKQVYARKGVIVCAGLYSSPFLMQSGVGPQALLQSLSIPVVYNNPNVGQGLVDQPRVLVAFSSKPKDTSPSNTKVFDQISWLPDPAGDPTLRAFRLAIASHAPGTSIGYFDLLLPQSRGYITINSNDPTVQPVIDLGLLSNSNDLALYVRGLQTYLKALNAQLQIKNPKYKLVNPNPALLDDVNAITAFVKENIRSTFSYQCHCRMAPLDQGGVVDGTGRVYGVTNLFVADDSILPTPMDGSTMASAYLVGLNIALMLREAN